VSSILKALKKLEKETGGNPPGFLPENAGKPRRQRKNTPVFGIVVLLMVGLAGAGAIVYYFGAYRDPYPGPHLAPQSAETETAFRRDDIPALELPASSIKEPEAAVKEADNPPQKSLAADPAGPDFASFGERTAGGRPAEFQQYTSRLSDDGERTSPVAPTASNPAEKSAGPGISGPEGPNPGSPALDAPVPDVPQVIESMRIQDATLPNDSKSPRPDFSAAAKPRSAATPAEPDKITSRIPLLDDPAIELQAISWSADPEKRMAIINGKICREKENVAGYVIDAIYAEAVVLSKGPVSGKLVFKIR
jgi:hypothetical protein